ncbi:MAG: SPOR domain-containing protein, partial [Saprospiraceae bacterium]|nr:SPOR domain-containing protein [Saprospiraceae bacterium]
YNVKPSRGESAPATGTDTAADTSGTTTADQDEAEGATVVPGQRYAIIAIGLFSRQENVNELFQRIYEEGYEPYKDSVNNLIRVGVQLPYQEEEEINRALQRIRREFDSQAFVLKKGQVANSPQ